MTENQTTPVIKFRAYKYRDKLAALELDRRLDEGSATEEDDVKFLVGMVTEWDLTDEDTGEPIEVGDYLNLSVVQLAQVQVAWRDYHKKVWGEVKKTKESPSSSGSTD